MALLNPIDLQDEYVYLEPMNLGHSQALFEAGQDLSIWKWTTHNYCETLESIRSWIKTCLKNKGLGVQLPFVIVDKVKGEIVGSSSYLNIVEQHKTIEIGYTFLNPSAQQSYVNQRCKLLLLCYAFETLKYNRVALQTHEKNQQSRTAILGIGAQFEGIHRYARIQQDGSIRDSAVYSIILPDWPAVKSNFINKVTRLSTRENDNVCA